MKKITLLVLMIVSNFTSNAQSTLFEDSFESYTNFAIANVGNWTLIDVDGGLCYPNNPAFTFLNFDVPKSFQVFNPEFSSLGAVNGVNWSAHTGTQSMVCFNKRTAPLVNDDWLISPSVTLGTGNTIKFWAKAGDDLTYFAEKFNVWISTTDTALPSFVKISVGDFITMPEPSLTWIEYTYTLPAIYDNIPVFIGIHCVSDDQYGLLIDDFKVTGTVPCGAPQNGTAIATGTSAALSWISAGGFNNSEVKVQLAGAGTPVAANNTGAAVNGATTYTASSLILNTNYEFWVRDECTDGTLFSTWSGPFLFNTNEVPNCATLIAPADAATAIPSFAPVVLSWTAATTGVTATSYDVYFGTAPIPVTLIENVSVLNASSPTVLASTTYYWKVIAKNAAGGAVGCTSVYSFTSGPNSFLPYCGPVAYTSGLEPITFVNFAGINKTYPNTVVPGATGVFHKKFTDVATVSQGSANPISLNGNTDSSGFLFTNIFTVFIDWNQNGILNDSGEVYFNPPLTINGNTGLPTETPVIGSIVVPVNATLGNTIMRIKKQFGTTSPILPCIGTGYGEIHDYNVTVTPQLATNTFDNATFASFPNPVKDVLNLSYDKNITNIFVTNLLGQEVLTAKINSNDAKIDMSSLNSGIYMVKILAENQEKTIKVIKE